MRRKGTVPTVRRINGIKERMTILILTTNAIVSEDTDNGAKPHGQPHRHRVDGSSAHS